MKEEQTSPNIKRLLVVLLMLTGVTAASVFVSAVGYAATYWFFIPKDIEQVFNPKFAHFFVDEKTKE